MKTAILAAAAALFAAAAHADERPSLNLVEQALGRGYGGMCGLDATPVAKNGYYRCVDIGPYRFVAEYNRIRGFVQLPGQPPFEILTTEGGAPAFTVKGPWQDDLNRRIATWWSDEVEGGRKLRDARMNDDKRSREAASTVLTYGQPAKPATQPAAQAQPTAPAPNVYYVMPPTYGQQSVQQQIQTQVAPAGGTMLAAPNAGEIPVTGVPGLQQGAAPAQPVGGTTPPAGVKIAPGVIAYPNGYKPSF